MNEFDRTYSKIINALSTDSRRSIANEGIISGIKNIISSFKEYSPGKSYTPEKLKEIASQYCYLPCTDHSDLYYYDQYSPRRSSPDAIREDIKLTKQALKMRLSILRNEEPVMLLKSGVLEMYIDLESEEYDERKRIKEVLISLMKTDEENKETAHLEPIKTLIQKFLKWYTVKDDSDIKRPLAFWLRECYGAEMPELGKGYE